MQVGLQMDSQMELQSNMQLNKVGDSALGTAGKACRQTAKHK